VGTGILGTRTLLPSSATLAENSRMEKDTKVVGDLMIGIEAHHHIAMSFLGIGFVVSHL